MAVARKMLVSVYYMLKRRELYHGEAVELKRKKVFRMRGLASDRPSRNREAETPSIDTWWPKAFIAIIAGDISYKSIASLKRLIHYSWKKWE